MNIVIDCEAIMDFTLCSFHIKRKQILPHYFIVITHLPSRIGYYNTLLELDLFFDETVDILNSSFTRN